MTKGSLSWQDATSLLHEEVVVTGLDYTILYANQPVAERLGLALNEIVGLPCYQVFWGKESPCHERGQECSLRLVIETGRPATVVYRRARPEGYGRYNEIEAYPLRDAKGKIEAVLSLSRELGLPERYQRIFHTMADGVVVVSDQGELVDANPALCRMLGYTGEELARMKLDDLVAPDVASNLRDAPEGSLYVELNLPRKDGSLLAAEVTVSPLPLEPVTLYVAFVRDLSRRRQGEETIARQAQALAQSEAQYRALFESAGDALVVIEEDTTIAMVNRRFEESTGYSREEIEGKMSFLALVSEEERQRILEMHRQRWERLQDAPSQYETWGVAKDGQKWLAEVSAALIPGTKRSLVSLRDITEEHRLQEEARRRSRELEALYTVASLVSRSTDVEAMLEGVLDTVLELMGQSRGFLYLLDQEQQKLFIKAHRGASARALKEADGLALGEGFGGRVAQTGESIFVRDISQDQRLTRRVILEEGFRALAAVPLVSGDRVLGVLTVAGAEPREFSLGERRILVSLGNEIGVAVERAQLLQRAQERAQEMETLMAVTREMASTLDLQEVLDRTLAIMSQQVGASYGFVCLLEEGEGVLRVRSDWGERASPATMVRKVGEGVAGWAAQHQQPILCDDIAADPRIHGSQAPGIGYHSSLAVPLKVKGKLLGVVCVASNEKAAFTETHLRLLSAYAAEASIALENALLHQEVMREASTDDLTGLANRRYFYMRLEEELKRAQRYGHPLSLLFLDVDDLKVINDRYGHLQGDELLRHLAALLTKVLRASDIAARFGGDEFVVLLPEATREEAANVARRLLVEVTPCPLLSGGSIPWQMSIGVAWMPLEGSYEVDLLRLADEAVYRAKQQGTGWEFARMEARQAPLSLDGGEEA